MAFLEYLNFTSTCHDLCIKYLKEMEVVRPLHISFDTNPVYRNVVCHISNLRLKVFPAVTRAYVACERAGTPNCQSGIISQSRRKVWKSEVAISNTMSFDGTCFASNLPNPGTQFRRPWPLSTYETKWHDKYLWGRYEEKSLLNKRQKWWRWWSNKVIVVGFWSSNFEPGKLKRFKNIK